MGADSPDLGISLEKPYEFPARHFLTHCGPSLMNAGTFSCSPQTVAVSINSQSDSGAHTEVDYNDPCSKLRARCAMHASPTARFTLLPARRSKSTLWGTQRVKT